MLMKTPRSRLGVAATLAIALLLAVAVAAAVAAPRGGTATPAVLERGKILFVSVCGSCHMLSAAGTKGKKGPNLGREASSHAEIVEKVRRGEDGMPSFRKSLTRAQIASIAAFVVSSTRRGSDD